MRRRLALRAELLARAHQADAEHRLPRAIDDDARRQRIARIDQPARQGHAIRGAVVRERVERRRHARPDLIPQRQEVAALLDALGNLARVAQRRGDYARSEARYREALRLAQALDDPVRISAFLSGLGVLAFSRGDYEQAEAHYAEGLRLARAMDERGLTHRRITSGAGHDAQELAAICPTAMIFVPGEHDGISHNPREYSTPEACRAGIDVLLSAVLALAD